MSAEPLFISLPTADRFGRLYGAAHGVSSALGLTETQFYGLLNAGVFRSDDQVDEWDAKECQT